MAQTDNTAIKGAAIGLIILFGIIIFAGLLFDNLTHGNAKAEESVLSIAVYAPAVPESQWGDASHGLKAKVSFNRPDPSQFVNSTIKIQYQNITDKDIVFLFDPNETLKSISAVNRDKWKLKLLPADKLVLSDKYHISEEQYEKRYSPSIHVINPGDIFEAEIMCIIDNAKMDMGFIDGYFDVSCVVDIDEQEVSKYQSGSDQQIWIGKIKAGECKIFLTMPHDGGCNDCHGDADYHHGVVSEYCGLCHAEETDILDDTCIRCHKRHEQHEYGRRRVLGPEGDFDNTSKHISGIIEDSDCLVCHDMTKHGYGIVFLNDPNSPGTRTFTDEYTEFCLSCHNSNPPEGVEFPEKIVETEDEHDDFSDMLESYGDYEDESDSFDDNPFAGFGSFSEDDSSSEDDNGYPDVTDTSEDSFGFGGMDSMWGGTAGDSEGTFHLDSGTSIYDKSDFINSELFKKNIDCTDCHRSHGSKRPSLLKNVHGPDDKKRI